MDLFLLAQNIRTISQSSATPLWAVPVALLVTMAWIYSVWGSHRPEPVVLTQTEAPVWPLHIEQELRGFWALTPHQPDIDDLVEDWRAWMQHYGKYTAVDQKAAFMRDRTIRLNKGDLSLVPPVVPAIRAI